MRWTPDEYLRLAAAALPYASGTSTPYDLMREAQRRALPVERWRADGELRRLGQPPTSAPFLDALEQVRSMPSAEREPYLPGYPAAYRPARKSRAKAAPAQAPEPVQATPVAPSPRSTLGEAAKAFGERFAAGITGSLDNLILTAEREAEERMTARFEVALADFSRAVVEQLRAGIDNRVDARMEHALGGPVSPPPVQAEPITPVEPPHPPPPPPLEAKPDKLAIDVIGLIGPQVQVVKQAINGNADLRFITADHFSTQWDKRTPHVVLVNKFAGHGIYQTLKEAGVRPVVVTGAAPSVISAVLDLEGRQ